ncbi:MAG: carboxypeptidase regulatory-like domain-containing protein, partial [Bacteroidota bacterium]
MCLIFSAAYTQGVTTASINGRITDASGEALIGANVLATHVPSGSTYGISTDVDGYYRIPGMRVGGPYKIAFSYTGYETTEKGSISLSLGQSLKLNVQLSESSIGLEQVVVTAVRNEIFDGNRTGAETTVGQERIEATPTLGRSIGDFVQFNPQASIAEGNDGLEISIGGMNNRYNAIYIDGAVNNDVFGLAGSGTNGGQTGVSPISLDAIEEFQISVAPFDVRQSGFAGGAVNAVTRSGSNDFRGSAYWLFRNQSLAGVEPQEDGQDFEREKLDDFTAQTYGAWASGALKKDKAFFFISFEQQRDETPQPFNLANYAGNATEADINNLVNHLQSTYGFDPGSYDSNTAFLNSDKILAKLDFNLNNKNKLTVRHSFTQALNLEARSSSSSGLRFINGSEYFTSNTNSSALELNTIINNRMSNHLTIGATLVRDDRDPYDNTNDGPSIPFPAVFIDDGRGSFQFGSETFSTANRLDQDIITLNNNFEYYAGKHTFLIGANAEFYRTKNLFIPFNYGDYDWDRSQPMNGTDLADFIAGEPASFFIRSYSVVDNITGDESAAGIEFTGALFGLYAQDEIQVNDNFKLTLGLRADLQTFAQTPTNESFNANTIPLLEQFYDLQGARSGDFIDPQVYLSPRIGFNYDVNGAQTTQIRGGAGIFTSRIPLVWPGGAYNNSGVNRGTVLGGGFDFNPDINNQAPGNVDLN